MPNRTTVFKDGSNVSDICFQKQVFVSREKKKHFNISLDLIIALRTASDILCASNFKWWSTMTPKSLTDSAVGRMVSFILYKFATARDCSVCDYKFYM